MNRTTAQSDTREQVRRMRWMLISFALFSWMVIILGRLVWVQVIRHQEFIAHAAKLQNKRSETTAPRGPITDRSGQTLAVTELTDSVYADAAMVRKLTPEQRERMAQQIAPLLGLRVNELLAQLTEARGGQTWLKRQVAPEVAQQLRSTLKQQRIAAIGLARETQRHYPNGALAAHLLGAVGSDARGLEGIEKVFDKQLQGQSGRIEFEQDGRGNAFGRYDTPAIEGAKVITTLDRVLQHKVETILLAALRETNALSATAIVLDPATGEVLALANVPTFDPNERPKAMTDELNYLRKNRALTDLYEPGSVFKLVAYAGALEQGLIEPTTMIDCQGGTIRVPGRVTPVRDSHLGLGTVTAEEAFAKSSNVGAIKVAQQLGKEQLIAYIKRFGFLERTGIELPGEVKGVMLSDAQWQYGAMGVIPIGQGITVTALQAVTAFAAIANRGTWTQPHVIREVVSPTAGRIFAAQPKTRRVVSERVAGQLSQMMTHVVAGGTGRAAGKLAGYTAAGKTGTAQKAVNGRGYTDGKYIASFVGFVPATQPRFAIAVVLDEPKGLHQGGQVSAPLFNLIAEAALSDYNVAPDDERFRQDLAQLAAEAKAELAKTPSVKPQSVAPDTQAVAPAAPQTAALTRPQLNRVADAPVVAARVATMPTPKPQPTLTTRATPAPAGKIAAATSGMRSALVAETAPTGNGRDKRATNANANANVSANAAPAALMPDLLGKGSRAVTLACANLQMRLRMQGSGKVIKQVPAAGTRVRPGELCQIQLQ